MWLINAPRETGCHKIRRTEYMNFHFHIRLFVVTIAVFVVGSTAPAAFSASTTPPFKTVRVFWVKPSDVLYDKRIPDGITDVMKETQRYYQQELGKTFRLNDPVVEIDSNSHTASWFYTNQPSGEGDKAYYAVFNGYEELQKKYGLDPQFGNRWVVVEEVSASSTTLDQQGAGGGGWVFMSKHEADGSAGLRSEPMTRWYGGMVHELGHAMGLPDASSTNGSPMSASFYSYPNCHFKDNEKTSLLNNKTYGSFWVAPTELDPSNRMVASVPSALEWNLSYGQGHFCIEFVTCKPEQVAVTLFNMTGREAINSITFTSQAGKNICKLGTRHLDAGLFLCMLKCHGKTSCKKILIKM
jgi:hypothetical protein